MNKKMRELLASIEAKTKEARGYMDGEKKDVSKAAALMKEVAGLKEEFEVEKQLYEAEKEKNAPEAAVAEAKAKRSDEEALKAFGRAAKAGFKTEDYDGTLNESTPGDGGYTVPEDVRTQIEHLRESEFSFLSLVSRVPVKTNSGARTFKKRSQHTGFSKVGEAGKIGATSTPQFKRIAWNIDKYAGYMPVTNELLYDSDANVGREVAEWMAAESRATANRLILDVIHSNGDPVDFGDVDGLKKCVNVDLGAAFKKIAVIVTNDDGINYLDTLKESTTSNKYLLTPDPSDTMKFRLSIGGVTIPVENVPNNDMPSTPTYTLSSDTSVTQGKTYYTRTGSGTAESPYVYTEVETPTGNPSTSGYYEMDPTPRIPFIVGALKEGIVYWDRQQMSIAKSATASIGDFNAFEQDLTLYRAIEREDVTLRDEESFKYGYIQPAVPSGE